MADDTGTREHGIAAWPVKDVTAACIAQLKVVPQARSNEGFRVPATMPADALIPQADESIFLKLYVSQKILAGGRFDIASTDLYPNYAGRIFEIEDDGRKQLILVGMPNDLDIAYRTPAGATQSLPFLVYIPPSPQDTSADHKKLYPELYRSTAPDKVPLFYQDVSAYPYAWDWLFFQLFTNMYRLSYQLRRAERPYVFVVPLVKSFSEGIGFLSTRLQQCLLGVQRFYLREVRKDAAYPLEDLRHVTLASFSIGDSILSRFLLENRDRDVMRRRVKDLIVLDPPFGNERNRSPIMDTVISILRTRPDLSVFAYTQDAYYLRPLINTFLAPKGIAWDLAKQKVFADPRVKNVMFAYLEPPLFQKGIQDPLLKGVHNTFPNLFINNAVTRSSLTFAKPASGGMWHAEFPFLSSPPSK